MPGPLSHETRHALDVLRNYLAGENEAVQYSFSFLADLVTQIPSVMIGGIQAGFVPPDDVVSDPAGEVFALDPAASGTSTGSLALNLATGELAATWSVLSTPFSITGQVRCVETMQPPPSARFLFVIHEPSAGFFTLATTNI